MNANPVRRLLNRKAFAVASTAACAIAGAALSAMESSRPYAELAGSPPPEQVVGYAIAGALPGLISGFLLAVTVCEIARDLRYSCGRLQPKRPQTQAGCPERQERCPP